ncbi:RNA polymerase II transcription mediator complex subunit 9-domain-containing protein [Chaetomium tenue]|uniref:RNA polymerase II transcription mediator complex subunit 9-domain-containing protein n=1 Tax=Chaetomium tenue TaxID=1854479 RepID=A0ACB7NZH9_9PEZI|nr:RNA polymerase II transcription mediator complex subunit 9-domain-containing protein [Chaetomium globosum]
MATHLPAGLSPDSVDVVTELSSIITRLRAAQQQQQQPQQQSTTAATSAPGTKHATGVTGTTPLPSAATPNAGNSTQQHNHPSSSTTNQQQQHPHPLSHAPNNTGTTPKPNHPTTTNTTGTNTNPNPDPDTQLLSVKELPSATDGLKHKLQRARAAVRTLGDVRRAVAQQEAEMRALEGRRAAQARALGRAQADGLVFVRGGSVGGGGERGEGGEGEGGERMVE